jgi:hypothetical protein
MSSVINFSLGFFKWFSPYSEAQWYTRGEEVSGETLIIAPPSRTSPVSEKPCNFGAGSPMWSSGRRFWLQIQRSGFDSLRYHIFWQVVDLKRGPLSLVITIEELLERTSSGCGLENWDYGRREQSRWPRDTFYPQKLALTPPVSGKHSVGIVRSRIETTVFWFTLAYRM